MSLPTLSEYLEVQCRNLLAKAKDQLKQKPAIKLSDQFSLLESLLELIFDYFVSTNKIQTREAKEMMLKNLKQHLFDELLIWYERNETVLFKAKQENRFTASVDTPIEGLLQITASEIADKDLTALLTKEIKKMHQEEVVSL